MTNRACPRCQMAPPRRPWNGFSRVALCVGCWKLERQHQHTKTTARRKALRAAARAALPPPMCPVCGVNPPRRQLARAGKVPHCQACYGERMARKYRSKGKSDITAAEIERRYQAAMQQIRREGLKAGEAA